MKLEGTVSKMQWINPHAWIHVDVKRPDGKLETWMIEGGTPNTLFRRGFTKDSLKTGTRIVVDGYRAKDGSLRANGRDITFPDGRKLFLGSSGTGAPESNVNGLRRRRGFSPAWSAQRPTSGSDTWPNSTARHSPLMRTTSWPTGVPPFCACMRNPMSGPASTTGGTGPRRDRACA